MEKSRQAIWLALLCAIVAIFGVAGIAAAFVTRIELNIDGILLICTGLLMAGLFGLMLAMVAREQGWIPARGAAKADAGAPDKAADKSSSTATAGK